jgi:hypothetical protein
MDVRRRAIADDRFVHGVVIAALLQPREGVNGQYRPRTEPVLQAPYDRTMVIERPHARKLVAYWSRY